MVLERITSISICIVFTSSVAAGQQTSGRRDQEAANRVIEHSYDGRATAWRVVSSRSASGGRIIVIETVEAPNVDGRMSPIQESVTETSRSAPTRAQTRSEVFGFGGDGRRRLLRTIESEEETLTNQDTRAVHSTLTPDLNGRSAVTARTIENTRAVTPAVRETVTTILLPDLDAALHETIRVERTERTDPSVSRHESTQLDRDVNGRWQATEKRVGEVRQSGDSERLEEQTIERLDVNGRATVVLSERVRRTTTMTADGGRSTVDEVEGRNPASPGDPMRVIRRTVTTVRPNGSNRSITEREVFERDVNGRMTRIAAETEVSASTP